MIFNCTKESKHTLGIAVSKVTVNKPMVYIFPKIYTKLLQI